MFRRPIINITINIAMPSQDAPPGNGDLGAIKTDLETIMAQQDDLMAALARIGTSVDGVGTDVTTLVSELQALQNSTPPEVDLSGAIASATAIADKLDGIKAAADAVTPPPAQPADGAPTA